MLRQTLDRAERECGAADATARDTQCAEGLRLAVDFHEQFFGVAGGKVSPGSQGLVLRGEDVLEIDGPSVTHVGYHYI